MLTNTQLSPFLLHGQPQGGGLVVVLIHCRKLSCLCLSGFCLLLWPVPGGIQLCPTYSVVLKVPISIWNHKLFLALPDICNVPIWQTNVLILDYPSTFCDRSATLIKTKWHSDVVTVNPGGLN